MSNHAHHKLDTYRFPRAHVLRRRWNRAAAYVNRANRKAMIALPICELAGCRQPATACYYPDTDLMVSRPDAMLCVDHAFAAGFCWGCGRFWAGLESFDFNRHKLCPDCSHEYEREFEWLSDDEMYAPDYDDCPEVYAEYGGAA